MVSMYIFTVMFALSLAAQLPSKSYLPQRQGEGTANENLDGSGNRKSQQEKEIKSVILQQVQENEENGFHYAYETSNGIVAEESGDAEHTKGGFAYKGDDGHIYSIIFNAGIDGFRPQGDHLPIPPPTPAEILLALKQNERDEAAGTFDDGQYRPDLNEKSAKSRIQVPEASRLHTDVSQSGYTY